MKHKPSITRFWRTVSLSMTGMVIFQTVGCAQFSFTREAFQQSLSNFAEGFVQSLLYSLLSNVYLF